MLAATRFLLRTHGLDPETHLQRTSRAMRGWRKSTPTFQRLPLPWVVVSAIIGWLLHHREREVAVAVILAFSCYLRPGELPGLRMLQVIAPNLSGFGL